MAAPSASKRSIDTANADRDNHVRSADFFAVEEQKEMSFTSTGLRSTGGGFVLDGNLTLKGVTKPVSLDVELGGFGPDAWGGTRAGFSATGEIKRSDFGIDFNAVLETGGVAVGEKVKLELDVEALYVEDAATTSSAFA